MSILSLRNIKWYLYDPFGHCKRLNEIMNNVNINHMLTMAENISTI